MGARVEEQRRKAAEAEAAKKRQEAEAAAEKKRKEAEAAEAAKRKQKKLATEAAERQRVVDLKAGKIPVRTVGDHQVKHAAKDGNSLIAQPPLSAQSGLWLLQGNIEGAGSGSLGLNSVLICRNSEGFFILKLGTGAERQLRINQTITLVSKHVGTQALTMTNFFGAEHPEYVPVFQLVELYGD